MVGLELLAQHLVPFMLVVARLSGLFLFTPVLTNRTFPRRFRVMLALAFAAALYPTLPTAAQTPPNIDIMELLPLMVGEILIGLCIGFVAMLPITCLDLAGFIMGHQMGLGLARVFNPESNADTDILGQLFMTVGIAVYIAMGGLEVVYSTLIHTFGRIPPGGVSLAQTPLDLMLHVLSSGFELALRVAAPVVAVIFLLMIALGLISKTMPQLNVMSVGFTIKIVVGLVIAMVAVDAISDASAATIEQTLRSIAAWTQSLHESTPIPPMSPVQ